MASRLRLIVILQRHACRYGWHLFFVRRDTLGTAASGEYVSGDQGMLSMQRPKVDDDLTLLTDLGKTEAIVVEVLDNPAAEEGILLKVMIAGNEECSSPVIQSTPCLVTSHAP